MVVHLRRSLCCTSTPAFLPENILSQILLRGKEYPEAKAHLAQILPPEASPALQRRTHHETLNNREFMPKVSLED